MLLNQHYFKLIYLYNNLFYCNIKQKFIISNQLLTCCRNIFLLLLSELIVTQILHTLILQLLNYWIRILYLHKEIHFNSLCSFNHIHFKIIYHCSNNTLLLKAICPSINRNNLIHNFSKQRIHYKHIRYMVNLYFLMYLELRLILILICKRWFLHHLWMIVLYFIQPLDLLCHPSRMLHIILWWSMCCYLHQ